MVTPASPDPGASCEGFARKLPTILLRDGQLVIVSRETDGRLRGEFKVRFDRSSRSVARAWTIDALCDDIRVQYGRCTETTPGDDPVLRVIPHGTSNAGAPYVAGHLALASVLHDVKLYSAAALVAANERRFSPMILADIDAHVRNRPHVSHELLTSLVVAWSDRSPGFDRALTVWAADLSGCEDCVAAALRKAVTQCEECAKCDAEVSS